jgi:hypothetical protein
LRRDRPQASRSRHRRADRPILSPLIPGCSVTGDQDPSRFLIRGPMARRCPECELATSRQGPSEPRSQGGRILAADGCASSSSNPACCFCSVWAPSELTSRLRASAGAAVADGGRTVIQSARDHEISWPVTQAAFAAAAEAALPKQVPAVEHLGIDET